MATIRSYSISGKKIESKEFSELPPLNEIAQGEGSWIDIDGIDASAIDRIGELLEIDPLTTEDITKGNQRIKVEEFPGYLFAVCKGLAPAEKDNLEFGVEEISIIVRGNLVVTFHSENSLTISKVARAVMNRIDLTKKKILLSTTVFHIIYDFSVDSFYDVLSDVENWLIATGSKILDVEGLSASEIQDMRSQMAVIAHARRKMGELRILLTQHRDVMSLAERGALKGISTDMMPQFRDVYDHTFQLIETVDSYMTRTSDLRDLYFTLRAAFTDNVLRILTIVATIFLPLTFLTGFYGMNFTQGGGFFQPGTSSAFGFYVLTAAMLSIPVILIWAFRKKGWV
ncbi:MAG: magnesium transporter CorA family protein [Candidatus Thermoplasmatota archaeon]|jgi:magnesium transporter|nr:magnesium transporter CorA family protein [Candidatus Thermoplasmatota archaeon]MCL5786162.1 magnesium transporter CorA family protein [Candidatus Thermoplasmatota archaeon]